MSDLKTWRRQFAPEIVGDSREVIDALDTIFRVATTDCSILITGETGTGKELFARAAHRASLRRGKAFVPVNCAALPDALVEAELFGHVKGAFTGAMNTRAGRFVSAQGGTLFLDEVGDLPLSAQAKLLRVLEQHVVCPVGSDTDTPVDVRIVAATHHHLEQMVAQGRFRADLYFRLAVVPLHLPALRDRDDDFDLIIDLTLARVAEGTGREPMALEPEARRAIRSYAWPGNVRELAHKIERAALLSRGSIISAADLAIPSGSGALPVGVSSATRVDVVGHQELLELMNSTLDLRTALEQVERALIDRALSKANGNRTEAAALLGLNRTTLVEKLRKYAA